MMRSLLVAGLLFLGVASAAPTIDSTKDSGFDVVSWLNKAIFAEERELVTKQALHTWLMTDANAAKEANNEFIEYLKNQEDWKQAIDDQKAMNITQLLEKDIETDQLDISARRIFLSELNSMTDDEIKAKYGYVLNNQQSSGQSSSSSSQSGSSRSASDLKSHNGEHHTLRELLEEAIDDEEEALETRQRAAQYLLDHPEMQDVAERIRLGVIQRLESEGQMSSRLAEHAKEVGLTQALNHSVIFREKVLKGMKIALEILRNDPEQAKAASYQVMQMIQHPDLAQQMAESSDDEFETAQFGGGLGGLLPLLARAAATQGLVPTGPRLPFGQYAGGSAVSRGAAGMRAAGYGLGQGGNARYSAPFTTTPFILYF